jgi:SAM-dependent methyltransferase
MDAIAAYNHARWEALGRVGAVWTRPWLSLSPEEARRRLDPDGTLGEVAGKDVLCLASGGGQQSVGFAMLGARVTVVDLSPSQLARDVEAAKYHRLAIRTVQADMRDLSALEAAGFDLVCHPYSINFVPDCRPVFRAVARVARPGAVYELMTANPFLAGLGTHDWNGRAYELRRPYVAGALVECPDESWVTPGDASEAPRPSREYRHTLSALINGMSAEGLSVRSVREYTRSEPDAEPGGWDHLLSIAPLWLTFRAVREG